MPRVFTEESLRALVSCPKEVEDPPRKEMKVDGKMRRNDMTLKAVQGPEIFRVFLRQNLDFAENFSLGLVFVPIDGPGSFPLIRFNGQHGGTIAYPHHAYFHVHRSTSEDVNAGILEARNI